MLPCQQSSKNKWSLLRRVPLLWEDPEDELSFFMGFEGRGEDDVLSRGQTETCRDLSQVNVGLAFGFGGRVEEEVLLQMLILSTHLWMETNKPWEWNESVEMKWDGNELPPHTTVWRYRSLWGKPPSPRWTYLLWYLQRRHRRSSASLNGHQLIHSREDQRGLCVHYLVDGEPDGEELGPLMALHPPTFLHQSHDDGAGQPFVLWVIVLLIELQPVLRVRPKCVCATQSKSACCHRNLYTEEYDSVFLRYESRDNQTWEVPAATSRAPSHPPTLIYRHWPAMSFITLECVGGQVTHLQLSVVLLEIIETHPGGGKPKGKFVGEILYFWFLEKSQWFNHLIDFMVQWLTTEENKPKWGVTLKVSLGPTHQNSLVSTVCFRRFVLSPTEMVDHSFELWRETNTFISILLISCTFTTAWSYMGNNVI